MLIIKTSNYKGVYMTVNNLSDHISLNAVDQGISKLNTKIDDLQVARDIFTGMKALNDSDKRIYKIVPIACLTVGIILATVAVIAAVVTAIFIFSPIVVPVLAELLIALTPGIGLIALAGSIKTILISVNALRKKAKEEKIGLPGKKLNKYFNAFKAEKNWDNLTTEKNKILCDRATIDYRKSHNTQNVQLSELIKDINEKIKKAEDERSSFVNQKLMSESNIVPLDIHDYIANFTLALAAKELGS